MNPRFLFALMILFLGLGYFAFFEPLRTAPKEEAKNERDTHPAWALKDHRVESVRIAGGKANLELRCALPKKADCPLDGTGEWTLADPPGAKADPAAVGGLLGEILNLTHNGKLDFENGFNPQEFGLDQPKVTLTLRVAGQPQPLTLKFGNPSATSPNSYLSVSDDPKHLFFVPTYLVGQVDQNAFHWRNKRIFGTAEATAVSAIRWKSAKAGEISAQRVGDSWRLAKPRDVRASKIMFEGLGSTLSYLTAKSIFAETRSAPEAKQALAGAAELEIHFSLGGGEQHVVRVYPRPKSPREKLVLADDQVPVYAVDGTGFDRFNKALPEYRQRSVLSDADRAQVDELDLDFPREKKSIKLELQKGIWNPTGGDKLAGMVVQGRITALLDQLRDADFKVFLPANGPSAEARAWRAGAPDVRVSARVSGQEVGAASFLVFDRKQPITEAEGDVRIVGGQPFLVVLPVHFSDLLQPVERTVITNEKGEAHGFSAEPAQRGK